MRICVLDLGGMSFHLLHARLSGTGELFELDNLRMPTRLGSKTILTGVLDPIAWKAGLDDLGALCEHARMLAPDRILVVATSAIRAASNAHAFVAKARELFGIDMMVLTSRQEAELSYRGATSGEVLGAGAGSVAVVDLGGGSCEVAFGDGPDYRSSFSAEIGVLPLKEAFRIEDSLGPIKTGAISDVVRLALRPAEKILAQRPLDRLVFASGTARAVQGLARSVLGEVLPLGQISLAQAALLRNYVFNRMPQDFVAHGVDLHRADVIAIAVITMHTLMSSFQCKQAGFASRGLREGVALYEWERLQGKGPGGDRREPTELLSSALPR